MKLNSTLLWIVTWSAVISLCLLSAVIWISASLMVIAWLQIESKIAIACILFVAFWPFIKTYFAFLEAYMHLLRWIRYRLAKKLRRQMHECQEIDEL